MSKELCQMSFQCSEDPKSDSVELPPEKPEKGPCPEEERMEEEVPEMSSVPTVMQEELSPVSRMEVGVDDAVKEEPGRALLKDENGRERLKRHRTEMAGRVWIPDMWGQEDFLKDWVDCSAFDSSLVLSKIMSARAALVGEGPRADTTGLRIENRC